MANLDMREVGLVVSVLDSGSKGLDLSPDRGHCIVFLGKILCSHSASLHPGVYKCVPANYQGNLMKCWEVTCDGLAFHLIRRSSNSRSRFVLQKPR